MIFIGGELGSVAKSPLAKGIGGEKSSDECVAVVKWSGDEKGSVAKGSGGEKVGGEWVSDEKVSGE